MRIVGFNKTSLLDWDGHVVAVIYLPGCNFRCLYCHNRDIVLAPEVMEEVPFEVIEEYVRENNEFLDGLVVTGGEPTVHKDLPALLAKLRELGMKIKLDTNGSDPDMLQDLIDAGLVDYVALDIKAPLDAKYDDVAGTIVPLDRIKRSIEVLGTSDIDYEFRTTVVPILLTPEDVERIAAYIGGSRRFALQQFRPQNTLDPSLLAVRPYSGPEVLAMAEKARQYVHKVVVRGDL
jgi:pyruvate formate lyase activating enzyme